MNYQQLTQHSSHLWISNQTTLEQEVFTQLEAVLINNQSSNNDIIKQQIIEKTHPWINWIEPENSYTLEQIDQVINSVQFMLDKNEKRFFIFTNAQELSAACSNRLLKTIEEPLPGYYFIFMATGSQQVLPTLKSRCFVQTFENQHEEELYQEILQPFKHLSFNNPIPFMKLIDKHAIKESSTKEIVDILLEYYIKQLKHMVKENAANNQLLKHITIIAILKKNLNQLPISGSSKLFWKNLYLQFHTATT